MGWAETGTDRVRRTGVLRARYRTTMTHPNGGVLVIETGSRGHQREHATYVRDSLRAWIDDETTTLDFGARRPATAGQVDPRSNARVVTLEPRLGR